jgi:archaellum component FlaC
MSTDPEGRSEHNEAADPIENIDQFLAKADDDLKRLDEEIREAEKKSKAVIREPEP